MSGVDVRAGTGSTAGTADTAGTAPPAGPRTWFYVKLYPGRLELLDATLRDVVAPFVADNAGSTVRWFFLRYFDQAGPHVRLRLLTGWDEADALAARHGELLAGLRGLPGQSRSAPRPVPPGSSLPGDDRATQRPPAVRLDLYEPELAKWGGPEGMAAAERMFQRSSELALELLEEVDDDPVARLSLATVLLTSTAAALGLAGSALTGFLETHYAWWSGASRPDGAARDQELRRTFADLAPDIMRGRGELAGHRRVPPLVGEFTTGLLEQLRDCGPRSKPLFLTFHQLHLMLNRIGVLPAEEAVVSLASRAVLAPIAEPFP